MSPRDMLTLTIVMTSLAVAATDGASVGLDPEDYELLTDREAASVQDGSSDTREVRCYCNQPECVRQGYMCRGRGCFTELPSSVNPSLLRVEHNTYSGCLMESLKDQRCPLGLLCCGQDLCNHVDSPAMKNRLNKTLQVLVSDQRAYLGSLQPSIGHGSQAAEGWFKTATIAVPICGLIALLILAGLAVRLLQQMPAQGNKLGPHRTPDNGPPLLGPSKVPLV